MNFKIKKGGLTQKVLHNKEQRKVAQEMISSQFLESNKGEKTGKALSAFLHIINDTTVIIQMIFDPVTEFQKKDDDTLNPAQQAVYDAGITKVINSKVMEDQEIRRRIEECEERINEPNSSSISFSQTETHTHVVPKTRATDLITEFRKTRGIRIFSHISIKLYARNQKIFLSKQLEENIVINTAEQFIAIVIEMFRFMKEINPEPTEHLSPNVKMIILQPAFNDIEHLQDIKPIIEAHGNQKDYDSPSNHDTKSAVSYDHSKEKLISARKFHLASQCIPSEEEDDEYYEKFIETQEGKLNGCIEMDLQELLLNK